MQIDLEHLSETREFASTVCVIGAGIAGLLIARQLANQGIDVNLIEGGGHTLEDRSQELYSVKMVGRHHDGATNGRFRVFGGSSTRWGGQLLSYTDDVFDPPPEVPSARWPINNQDLEQYYADVEDVMHVSHQQPDEKGFNPTYREADAEVNLRFSKWAPFSKRNLASTIGRECLTNRRITLFLHANVTSVEINKATERIESAIAKNYCEKKIVFRAKYFVICTGTIETSRLLLASNKTFDCGVGNHFDHVGRYFHDHISVAAAAVEGEARLGFTKSFSPALIDGTLYTPKLEASTELRRKNNLLAVMAHFSIEEPEDTGAAAARHLLQGIQRGQSPKALLRDALALTRDSKEIARLVWYAHIQKRRAISKNAKITLRIDCEQLPTAGCRIRLSEERDSLGMPRAILDWCISVDERRAVQFYAGTIDRFLQRAGVSPLMWRPEFRQTDDSWLQLTSDTYHQMGGTRMGVNPRTSVVDPDLQVQGVPNLFIASCSVFPGGGSSNPTFTLMALALRLGRHMGKLCSSSAVANVQTGNSDRLPRLQEPCEETRPVLG